MKILYFFILLSLPCIGNALEADQYLVWKIDEMDDSVIIVNQYINETLASYLENKINKYTASSNVSDTQSKFHDYKNQNLATKKNLSCEDISKKFLKHMRPHFFKSKLAGYLVKEETADVFPKKRHLIKDLRQSIYRKYLWPPLMPVGRNVKINGVYLGTDKISHFFSSGRRYYNRYSKFIKKGITPNEALHKSIGYGLGFIEERGMLGFWSSGAFSFADLEANYQGMILGIDMCEGSNKILTLDENKKWKAEKQIDIKKYINPLWDEAFNNSFYDKLHKNGVIKIIKKEYCSLGLQNRPQKLWSSYKKNIPNNLNYIYLKKMIREEKIPNPNEQSLATICEYPEGIMEGPYTSF